MHMNPTLTNVILNLNIAEINPNPSFDFCCQAVNLKILMPLSLTDFQMFCCVFAALAHAYSIQTIQKSRSTTHSHMKLANIIF